MPTMANNFSGLPMKSCILPSIKDAIRYTGGDDFFILRKKAACLKKKGYPSHWFSR